MKHFLFIKQIIISKIALNLTKISGRGKLTMFSPQNITSNLYLQQKACRGFLLLRNAAQMLCRVLITTE